MRVRTLPSADILRQLLDCDPETGSLRWKPRGVEWFEDSPRRANVCSVWNARYAGTVAFKIKDATGYLRGKLLGETVLAHRVIWKHVTGEEPEFIDHINGDKSDNRFSNLRSVSWAENAMNRSRPRNNSSGAIGVHWCNTRKLWIAQISVGGKQRQIGGFHDKDEAIAFRLAASQQRGFHPNHGR